MIIDKNNYNQYYYSGWFKCEDADVGVTRIEYIPPGTMIMQCTDNPLEYICDISEGVTVLDIRDCTTLTKLPNLPSTLTILYIDSCGFDEEYLEYLRIRYGNIINMTPSFKMIAGLTRGTNG